MADDNELDEAAVLDEAMICNHQGDHERAIELCTQLIEAAEDDPWAQPFYFRGSSRLALGDAEGALADLSEAIRLEPNIPYFAFHDRGRALTELERHEEALADFDQAIQLHPDFSFSHGCRGTTLYHLGRLDDSLAAYTEAIRLRPDGAETYSDRGAVYLAKEQLDEAQADFTRALERRPDAEFYFYRGTVHLRRMDWPESLADLDKALELDPEHARAWYAHGYAHFRNRNCKQGEADFARAVELNPSLQDWPYEERWLNEQHGRVEAYLRSGELTKAAVPDEPVWDLAPYLALWQVGKGRSGLWVLVGDCPTDHLPASAGSTPRQAIEAFGQRWLRSAESMSSGQGEPEVEVGPREDWPKLGPMLRTRGELLLEYAANESLWQQ